MSDIVDADLMNEALHRAADAQKQYGDFASMHEAYGVLCEEMAELLDAVRMRQNAGPLRSAAIATEALDIAAVALRIATQAHRVTR